MPKRAGSNAETSFETRRRCLEAGAAMFFLQQERDKPFRRIDITSVAEAAEVTRKGFYYHWATKKDFERDLVKYLLSESEIFEEDFRRLRREVELTEDVSAFEAVSRTATVDLETVDTSTVWAAMELLVIGYTKHSEEYAEIARAGYCSIDKSIWEDIYGTITARTGREPRPPFTGEAIGSILQALVEGAGLRHLFDPGKLSQSEHLSADTPSKYGAFALAVTAVVTAFTRRTDDDDSRTVEELLRELLD